MSSESVDKVREVRVILERGKCSWGRCYFCGWGKKVVYRPIDELKHMLLKKLKDAKAERLKIFVSGSFLDDAQFPPEFRRWCLEEARRHGIQEVVIESRPEFITREKLEPLLEVDVKLTVAIGLELADDNILLNYYNKGLTVQDYLRAVELLRSLNVGVRTYILVNGHPILYNNPTFHREVVRKSIELAVKMSDSVVVINAYPHEKSQLLRDWLVQRWRPLTREEFLSIVGEWCSNPKVELDFENFQFMPKIPREMRIFIRGVGRDVLLHPHFEVWQEYLVKFYEPPSGKEYVLFIPCTYRKPYKRSKTHRVILNVLRRQPWFHKLHLYVVSVPGVIPYELHDRYPFTHYDWPEWEETEEVKRDYIEITKTRVKNFFSVHGWRYKLFFTFFHLESETLRAIEEAFEEIGLKDRLVNVLDWNTYLRIKQEFGKEKIGSSILRHRLALGRLIQILSTYLGRDVSSGDNTGETANNNQH